MSLSRQLYNVTLCCTKDKSVKNQIIRSPLHALFVLFLLLVPPTLALADRGIIDQDGGTYFVSPLNRDWSQLAFYGGHLKPADFAKMNPDAIKAGKGRFQHFTLTST